MGNNGGRSLLFLSLYYCAVNAGDEIDQEYVVRMGVNEIWFRVLSNVRLCY